MAMVAKELRDRLFKTMADVVPRRSRVALLDFPDHTNVGDSAIWLGELATLKHLESKICYVATLTTYRAERLRRALGPDGIVLLHGGGNFGDLWPRHQDHREQVVRELGDYPIVQLPQSICFQDRARLEEARRVLQSHDRLTVVVRDNDSLAVAHEKLELAAVLCPDSAFAIGAIAPRRGPVQPVVWLSRDDHEGSASPVSSSEGVIREDWIQEPATLLLRAVALVRRLPHPPQGLSRRMFEALVEARVARGCALIGRGAALVTNRLHGMILSILMGIPPFVYDTRQGKIGAFHRTWLADSMPGVMWDSEREALDRARESVSTLAAAMSNRGTPWN
jgi:pyruvyl transferase EpsO